MRKQAGFILLETIIAFVIAAAALAALFAIASIGLRAAHVAGRYEDALSRARSRLAVVARRDATFIAGEQQGDDGDGYHWQVRIARLAEAPIGSQGGANGAANPAGGLGVAPAVGASRAALYAVAVAISWHEDGGARQIWLRTERVAAAAAAKP